MNINSSSLQPLLHPNESLENIQQTLQTDDLVSTEFSTLLTEEVDQLNHDLLAPEKFISNTTDNLVSPKQSTLLANKTDPLSPVNNSLLSPEKFISNTTDNLVSPKQPTLLANKADPLSAVNNSLLSPEKFISNTTDNLVSPRQSTLLANKTDPLSPVNNSLLSPEKFISNTTDNLVSPRQSTLLANKTDPLSPVNNSLLSPEKFISNTTDNLVSPKQPTLLANKADPLSAVNNSLLSPEKFISNTTDNLVSPRQSTLLANKTDPLSAVNNSLLSPEKFISNTTDNLVSPKQPTLLANKTDPLNPVNNSLLSPEKFISNTTGNLQDIADLLGKNLPSDYDFEQTIQDLNTKATDQRNEGIKDLANLETKLTNFSEQLIEKTTELEPSKLKEKIAGIIDEFQHIKKILRNNNTQPQKEQPLTEKALTNKIPQDKETSSVNPQNANETNEISTLKKQTQYLAKEISTIKEILYKQAPKQLSTSDSISLPTKKQHKNITELLNNAPIQKELMATTALISPQLNTNNSTPIADLTPSAEQLDKEKEQQLSKIPINPELKHPTIKTTTQHENFVNKTSNEESPLIVSKIQQKSAPPVVNTSLREPIESSEPTLKSAPLLIPTQVISKSIPEDLNINLENELLAVTLVNKTPSALPEKIEPNLPLKQEAEYSIAENLFMHTGQMKNLENNKVKLSNDLIDAPLPPLSEKIELNFALKQEPNYSTAENLFIHIGQARNLEPKETKLAVESMKQKRPVIADATAKIDPNLFSNQTNKDTTFEVEDTTIIISSDAKNNPLLLKKIKEDILPATPEKTELNSLINKPAPVKTDLKPSILPTDTQKEKIITSDIINPELNNEKNTSKFTTDIAMLNKAVMTENKVEIPPMTKHFSHPEWNKEMGERIVWMHKKTIPRAELRLNPRHLGPISIKVESAQDQISITFTAQHATVKEAIEGALPKLKEMFIAQQLNLVDVNVSQHDSGQKQPGGNINQWGNGSQNNKQSEQETPHNENSEKTIEIADEIEAGRAISSHGLLNIFA